MRGRRGKGVNTEERTSTQLEALEARLKAIGDQMGLLIKIELVIAAVIVAWGVASIGLAWLLGRWLISPAGAASP